MPTPLFQPGNKFSKGWPKGKPRGVDFTTMTKQVIERLGGIEAYFKWAQANPDQFWPAVMKKLLPTEIKADVTHSTHEDWVRRIQAFHQQQVVDAIAKPVESLPEPVSAPVSVSVCDISLPGFSVSSNS